MAAPLLSLSTPNRPFLTIDGQPYELAVPDDFGLVEVNRLQGILARLNAIRPRADELSEAEVASLVEILRVGAALTLRAPAEVLERLTDRQRLAIIDAFATASTNRATRRRRHES